MPRHHDIEHDTQDELSLFECLQCGTIVESTTHPAQCEECGGEFQNRAKSLE